MRTVLLFGFLILGVLNNGSGRIVFVITLWASLVINLLVNLEIDLS